MAVKVEEKPVAMASGPIKKQRSKKEKYTNAHLPFPPSWWCMHEEMAERIQVFDYKLGRYHGGSIWHE